MLEEAGFTVLTASDGLEALDIAEQYQPGLITCDVMMPRLDGLATLRALKQRPATSHKRHYVDGCWRSARCPSACHSRCKPRIRVHRPECKSDCLVWNSYSGARHGTEGQVVGPRHQSSYQVAEAVSARTFEVMLWIAQDSADEYPVTQPVSQELPPCGELEACGRRSAP